MAAVKPRGAKTNPSPTTALLPETAAAAPSGGGTSPPAAAPLAPNDHFARPKAPQPMPWELAFGDRKAVSKDPRMMKHCRDEAQWKGTIMEGVWLDIRKFAPALNDWIMTREQLSELLVYWGIASAHMHGKVSDLLDPKDTNKINALVLCKYLELVAQSPELRPVLLKHCYDMFDQVNSMLSTRLVMTAELANPAETGSAGSGSPGRKKKGSTLPATMRSGASFRQVAAFRVLLTSLSLSDPEYVTLEEFSTMAFDEEHSYFVAACAPQIIEVMCSRCSPPRGSLPLLSMRWLLTTEPVAAGEEMYDADIVLLRALEISGGENAKKDSKKKKTSASPTKTK
jgi:hypothetical protein